MTARGVIHNRDAARQIQDFSGMTWPGGITPTNIDGVIEFRNKAWVIFELKYGRSANMKYGQRLALDRMCSDLEAAGKKVLGIVGVHNTAQDEDIDVANTPVSEIWSTEDQQHWRSLRQTLTVKEAIDRFLLVNGIL